MPTKEPRLTHGPALESDADMRWACVLWLLVLGCATTPTRLSEIRTELLAEDPDASSLADPNHYLGLAERALETHAFQSARSALRSAWELEALRRSGLAELPIEPVNLDRLRPLAARARASRVFLAAWTENAPVDEDLVDSVLHADEVPPVALEAAFEAARGDRRRAILLLHANSTAYPAGFVERLLQGSSADVQAASDLLENDLLRISAQEAQAKAVPRLKALVTADPWHASAQVLLALLAEHGDQAPSEVLWSVARRLPVMRAVREDLGILQRESVEQPQSPGRRLAFALALAAQFDVGPAVAQAYGDGPLEQKVRAAALARVGLAQKLEAWPNEPSRFLGLQFAAAFDPETNPDSLPGRALAAAVRSSGAAPSRVDFWGLVHGLDPSLPLRIGAADPLIVALLEDCLGATIDDCSERYWDVQSATVGGFDEVDVEALLQILPKLKHVDADWLRIEGQLQASTMPLLEKALLKLANRRVAKSVAYHRALFWTNLWRNEFEEADRLLAMLSPAVPEQEVAAHYILQDDLVSGRATFEQAMSAYVASQRLWNAELSVSEEDGPAELEGPSWTERLQLATRAANEGQAQRVETALAPLEGQLPGRAGHMLSVLLASAALAKGESDQARMLLEGLPRSSRHRRFLNIELSDDPEIRARRTLELFLADRDFAAARRFGLALVAQTPGPELVGALRTWSGHSIVFDANLDHEGAQGRDLRILLEGELYERLELAARGAQVPSWRIRSLINERLPQVLGEASVEEARRLLSPRYEFALAPEQRAMLRLLVGDFSADEAPSPRAAFFFREVGAVAMPTELRARFAHYFYRNQDAEAALALAEEATQLGMDGMVCRLLIDADLVDAAAKPCVRAWPSREPELAVALAGLAVEHPGSLEGTGMRAEDLFATDPETDEELGGAWVRHKVEWLATRGEGEAAAQVYERQWLAAPATMWRQRDVSRPVHRAIAIHAPVTATSLQYYNGASLAPVGLAVRGIFAAAGDDLLAMELYGWAAEAAVQRMGEASEDEGLIALIEFVRLGPSVARADIERGSLKAEDISDVYDSFFSQQSSIHVRHLARHPESDFILMAIAEQTIPPGTIGLPRVLRAHARHPSVGGLSVLAAQIALRLQTPQAKASAAEAVADSLQAGSRDLRLPYLASVLAPPRNHSEGLPDFLRSAPALVAHLKGTEQTMRAVEARLHEDQEVGMELALPGEQGSEDDGLSFEREGLRIHVERQANVSRQSSEVLFPTLRREFEAGESIWVEEVELAGRPTMLALTPVGSTVLLQAIRVEQQWLEKLVLVAPPELFEARQAEVWWALHTYRSTDGFLSAENAAMISQLGRFWSGDERRALLRAFFVQNHESEAPCPKDMTPDLWADVFKVLPASDRARVVACSNPGDAGLLGPLAALDDDPVVARFGSEAIEASPECTVQLLQAVPLIQRSDQTTRPFGALQLMALLPEEARRRAGKSMVRASDVAHVQAIVAHYFFGDGLGEDLLATDLRSGTIETASLVAASLRSSASEEAVVEAAYARLADTNKAETKDEILLVKRLLWGLAPRLDEKTIQAFDDLYARIPELSDQLGGGVYAEGLPSRYEALAQAIEGGKRVEDLEEELRPVATWIFGTSTQPRDWRKDELHDLVAPKDGMLVRLAEPELLAPLLRTMTKAVDFGEGPSGGMLRTVLRRLSDQLDHTLPSGLLVPGAPMTCASGGKHRVLCELQVEDMDALRRRLASTRDGLELTSIPEGLIVGAGTMATLTAVPSLFMSGLLKHQAAKPSVEPRDTRLAQSFRMNTELLGESAEGIVRFTLFEGGAFRKDNVSMLADGRRALVGKPSAFKDLIGAPDQAPLSVEDRNWLGGRTSGAHALLFEEGQSGAPGRLSVTMTGDGVEVRLRLQGDKEETSQDTLERLAGGLPEGALNRLVVGGPATSFFAGLVEQIGSDVTVPLPTWWIDPERPFALGWYEGQALENGWVLVLPEPDEDRASSEDNPEHFETRDGFAVISPVDGLRAEALARLGDKQRLPIEGFILGQVDNEASASAMEASLYGGFIPTQTRMVAGMFTQLVRMSQKSELEGATSEQGELLVRASMRFAKRDDDTATLPVVAAALARPRNTLMLPRVVRVDDARRPMTLIFESPAARELGRLFAEGHRNEVELGEGMTRVTIHPGPSDAQTEAGPEAKDLELPPGAIRSLARTLIREEDAVEERVRKLMGWVESNLSYELTGQALSSEAVLNRRRGDCTEYSVLLADLLRASGIPARLRLGFMATGNTMTAHAWVAYHDGETWKEVDPTNPELIVGSGHIATSVVDMMALLSFSDFEIVAVETR